MYRQPVALVVTLSQNVRTTAAAAAVRDGGGTRHECTRIVSGSGGTWPQINDKSST